LQLAQLGVSADFDLVEQLRKSAGSLVNVGPGLFISRGKTGLVKLRTQQPVAFNASEHGVKLSGRAGEVNYNGVRLHWRFQRAKMFTRPRRRAEREFFDADKVGGRITLRHWRPGDRFQPIGMKPALKLQDWFVNQRIPGARRRELVIAAAETGAIFWVEGLRIGENFKLTPQTKRCLIWRWQRAEMKKTSALHRGCE
jgi:tRNA(Ile)-lysidine synthase